MKLKIKRNTLNELKGFLDKHKIIKYEYKIDDFTLEMKKDTSHMPAEIVGFLTIFFAAMIFKVDIVIIIVYFVLYWFAKKIYELKILKPRTINISEKTEIKTESYFDNTKEERMKK